MIVNCEAPSVALLTTALYPYMEKSPKDPDSVDGRVLHVSSGAAPPVRVGWSCYGISKAAFFFVFVFVFFVFVFFVFQSFKSVGT